MRRPFPALYPALPAALALLLSACGGGGTAPVKSASVSVPRAPAPRSTVRAPGRRPPPPPVVQALPGTTGVIGATAAELVRQFGEPRLDVIEGDARKLQYSAAPCVLDIYLYPAAPGREAQASYVDARRASDAQEVDRAACIAALKRR